MRDNYIVSLLLSGAHFILFVRISTIMVNKDEYILLKVHNGKSGIQSFFFNALSP